MRGAAGNNGVKWMPSAELRLDMRFDGIVKLLAESYLPSQVSQHQTDGGTADPMSGRRDTAGRRAVTWRAFGAQRRRVSLELMASGTLLSPPASRNHCRLPAA